MSLTNSINDSQLNANDLAVGVTQENQNQD